MAENKKENQKNLSENIATGVGQELMLDAAISAVLPGAGPMINLMRKFSTAKKVIKTVGKTAALETAKTITDDGSKEEQNTQIEEAALKVLMNGRANGDG